MKKIGMIAAMEKELSPLLSSLGEITEICALPYPVKLLKTNKAEVYLLQSGVGELAAAGATQYLITALGCDTIWNFGVVGGLTEEMDVNRTVFVEKVVHYAFDTSAIDPVPRGQYYYKDTPYFYADKALLEDAQKALPSAKKVTIASADKFVASPAEKEAIATEFSADICDMESAGIAVICEKNQVPFFMVKAVSDSKNDGAKFNDLVTDACEKFAVTVKQLLASL